MKMKNLTIYICMLLMLTAAFVPMFTERATAANSSKTWDTDTDFSTGTFVNTVSMQSGSPAIVELDSTVSWNTINYGSLLNGRIWSAMAFDDTDGVALVYGGDTSSHFLEDNVYPVAYYTAEAVEYDPSTDFWTGVSAGGAGEPEWRDGTAMVYESANDVILMFGGYGRLGVTGTELNDLWEYNAATDTWTNLIPNGVGGSPPGRAYHSMVYDSTNGVVVLFGGDDGTNYLNDTWEYDYGTGTWTQTTPAIPTPFNNPSARQQASMSFDSSTGTCILYGGTDGAWYDDPTFPDMIWEYDAATDTWLELNPTFNPAATHGTSMVYDPVLGESVLFGGLISGAPQDLIWTFNRASTNNWTIGPSTMAPRTFHSMVYDSVNGQMIVYGGSMASLFPWTNSFGDVFTYNSTTSTWTDLYPLRDTPPPTHSSSMTFDEANNRAIIFSGYSVKGWTDRVWGYNATSDTWELQPPSGSFPLPQGRYAHSWVYAPIIGQTIMVGGYDANFLDPFFINDVWSYNYATNAWFSRGSAGFLEGRAHHEMVYSTVDDSIVLFGGLRNSGPPSWTATYYDDTWIYYPQNNSWFDVTSADGSHPSGRYGHAMAYDNINHKVILFGGYNGASLTSDAWAFDPLTRQWEPMSPGPSARIHGEMVFHSGRGAAILFGGLATTQYLDDTYAYTYDVGGGTWTDLGVSTVESSFGTNHMMAYDNINNVAILFGGGPLLSSAIRTVRNATWELQTTYVNLGQFTTDSFDAGGPVANWGVLNWSGTEPMNTNISFQIASDDDGLGPWTYYGPGGTSAPTDTYNAAPGISIPIWSGHDGDQYLRVRVYFSTTDTSITPKLDWITVMYNMAPNAPTLITPIGGAPTNSTPMFQWAFNDPDPDTQAGFQLLVNDSLMANICDTGMVASSDEFWNLDTMDCGGSPLADGAYTWTVKTQDQDGIWGIYAPSESFVVDSLAPMFANFAPVNNSYTNDAQQVISVQITDATSGVDDTSILITVNGTAYDTTNPGVDWNWATDTLTFDPATAGQTFFDTQMVEVIIYAEDNITNANTSTWYFNVDLSPPGFSNAWPVDSDWSNVALQVISIDIADTGSGVDATSLTMNIEQTNYTNSVSPAISWDGVTLSFDPLGVTAFTDGQVVDVIAYADDLVGNGDSYTWSFVMDLSLPSLTNPNPLDSSYSGEDQQVIDVDISDTGSGLNVASLTMNVEGTDYVYGVSTAVSWIGGTLSFDPAGVTTFTDGQVVNITASADDIAGNSNSLTWSFTVDLSPPFTTLTPGTPNHTAPPDFFVGPSTPFSLSSVDQYSGVDSIWYKNDTAGQWLLYSSSFTLASLAEGSHTISYNATDNVGNQEAIKTFSVKLDKTGPITDITVQEPNEDVSGILYIGPTTGFTLTATDNVGGSGVAYIEYKIGALGTYTTYVGEFNLSTEPDGSTRTVYFRAVDNVGNIGPEGNQVVLCDFSAPTADAGSSTTIEIDTTLTLDGSGSTDTGVGIIVSYNWTITAPDSTQDVGSGSSFDYLFDQLGDYEVTLNVTDAVGNEGSETITIHVTETGVEEGTVNVHISDEDTGADIPSATIKISNSSGPVATHTTDSNGNASFVLPYGDYTIEVTKDGYNVYSGSLSVNEQTETLSLDLTPTAPIPPEEEEEFPWWIIVVVVVIIVVVILLLLLLMRRKKPAEEGAAPPKAKAKAAPPKKPAGKPPTKPPAKPPKSPPPPSKPPAGPPPKGPPPKGPPPK